MWLLKVFVGIRNIHVQHRRSCLTDSLLSSCHKIVFLPVENYVYVKASVHNVCWVVEVPSCGFKLPILVPCNQCISRIKNRFPFIAAYLPIIQLINDDE